jgi:hypothetical protein
MLPIIPKFFFSRRECEEAIPEAVARASIRYEKPA